MARKPPLDRTVLFRMTAEQHERMKAEVVEWGYTDLSDMLRTAYRELRQRHIAEGKVKDVRRRGKQ